MTVQIKLKENEDWITIERKVFDLQRQESNYKREIITALSDYHNRCTICYRYSKRNNCEECNKYYLDCTCTPLTSYQIMHGEGK